MDEVYATLDQLTAEGATPTTERGRDLILLASRRIDRVTARWFAPRRQSYVVSGDGTRLWNHPAWVPIIHVVGITIAGRAVPTGEWEVDGACLELTNGRVFSRGATNVAIDLVAGMLEQRDPVTTEVAVEAGATTTTLEVVASAGLRVGDQLLIGATRPEPALVADISGNVLTVEPLVATAAEGAPVVSYGRSPLLIRQAAVLLAAEWQHGAATEEGEEARLRRSMTEEQIDKWKWKVATPTGGGAGGIGATSGLREVDDILADFTGDGIAIGVA